MHRKRFRRFAIGAAVLVTVFAGLAGAAGWFAWQSEVQRQKADANLQAAIKTAQTLTYEVTEQVSASEGVQQKVLLSIQQRVQSLLSELTAGQALPPEAREAQGWSYLNAAEASLSLGDAKTSLANAEMARAIFAALMVETDSPDARRGLAIALTKMGFALANLGRTSEAIERYVEALEILDRLIAGAPTTQTYLIDSYYPHDALGDAHAALGNLDAALASSRRALDIVRGLLQTSPDNLRFLKLFCQAIGQVAEVLQALGTFPSALAHLEEGYNRLSSVAALLEDDTEFQAIYAATQVAMCGLMVQMLQAGRSVPYCQGATTIFSRLLKSDPGNTNYLRELAAARTTHGDALLAPGDPKSALISYESALALCEQYVSSAPALPEAHAFVAIVHARIGALHRRGGDLGASVKSYRLAYAAIRRAAALWESSDEYSDLVMRAGLTLARAEELAGQSKEALAVYRETLEVLEILRSRQPEEVSIIEDLAYCHEQIGKLLDKQGDIAGSLMAYRKAIELLQSIPAEKHDEFHKRVLKRLMDRLQGSDAQSP
jgi:tetratricopeptide (TPR) repeat protein